MKVKITNTATNESYVAANKDDCRDKIDLSGYQSCLQMGDIMTMGAIIFEPVFNDRTTWELIGQYGDAVKERRK